MINIDDYIRNLESDMDVEEKKSKEYQHQLFKDYVVRNSSNKNLRLELQKQYLSGGKLEGEKGLRKQLAAFDLDYFGKAYLPHYFSRSSPAFHQELDEIWSHGVLKDLNPYEDNRQINRLSGTKSATAAPRGHAKSTNFTFKDSIHATLYQYKHYIVILSDSTEQAEGFLMDIKNEFEENPLMREDFGNLQGKVWKTSVINTTTDIKIEAIGSGKKIRGRKHRNWRPDLILLDDIENDENVNTPEQRKKLDSWFKKAVSKAGDTYTDIMLIGTILHYDSLLNNILTKNPEYVTKKYKALMCEAVDQELWDIWESIYIDLSNDSHKEDAYAFFESNQCEMLKGTKVLWESKWSYYELMIMKVSEGIASFNSEMQNEPIDPDNATFNEEWFDYYEDGEVDFSHPDFIFVGANDPSLGKNKKSDTSGIINLALNTKTGYMYVVEGSIERRKPDVIIQDIIEMSKRSKRDYGKGFYKFGVETVQFQYFFKDILMKISMELGEYLPIEEINSVQNKQLRIESLQPFVKNKYIKFNRKHKTLLKQMLEYPMGRNDDGPDALEMAVRLAIVVRTVAGKVEYKSVLRRALKFKKGAY